MYVLGVHSKKQIYMNTARMFRNIDIRPSAGRLVRGWNLGSFNFVLFIDIREDMRRGVLSWEMYVEV